MKLLMKLSQFYICTIMQDSRGQIIVKCGVAISAIMDDYIYIGVQY